MKKATYKLTGVTPLLMCNPSTVDPLSDWSKAIGAIYKLRKSQKNKLTETQENELRRLQWEAALYTDNGKIVIPSSMLKACMSRGAAKQRQGKEVYAGVFFDSSSVPLEYNGPDTLDELYNAGYLDVRVGKLQGKSSVVIVRPKFETWGCTFTVEIDEGVINLSDIDTALQVAGKIHGLGAYRISCKGDFGAFRSERV